MLLAFLACLFFTPTAAFAQTTTTYSNTATENITGGLGATCSNKQFSVSAGIVYDVDIGIVIDVGNRSNVTATLQSPGGTTINLANGTGGAADINVRFDDSAATAYAVNTATHNDAAAPYQFTLRPVGTLSSFTSTSAAGTWTLRICMSGLLQTAAFKRADLYITSPPSNYTDLSLAKSVTNASPTSGASNSYTLAVTNAALMPGTATGVVVTDLLPIGTTFVSATGTGTYNSANGLWSVGSVAPGQTQSITINFVVNASSGASVTNTAEITASNQPDIDSTPNDGVGDDYASASFSVVGARVAGTAPTLVCPVGTTIFDWDTRAWTTGATSASFAVTNIGNISFGLTNPSGTWLNNATYGGQSPVRQAVVTGGFTGQNSLFLLTDFTSRTVNAVTTITLNTAVPGAQFRIFDVDFASGQFSDRVTVTGTYNGAAVTPTLTNGVVNYVIGNSAYGDGTSADASPDGNVVVTFSGPVDTIFISYGNHSTAPTDPGQQAVALHDITFCTPQAVLSVTKVSSVISDGISATNPKSIPGAVMQYCILTSNAGSATATSVSAADTLPTTVTYVAGSMLSGTSCAGAATAEDDNNTGTDESDPYGASITGTTITGVAPTMAPGVSFALTFRATVN